MALLGAALVCGWAAAPALSARPDVPEAVDFEQPLPRLDRVGPISRAGRKGAHSHLGTGPVSYRSDPITAPKRFDLVGVAGELRPLELRARERGGPWSDWVRTAAGDPVYTGGSERVQVRARGWRPRGRLHYVRVSGTATGLASSPSKARPGKPKIVSRRAWGAERNHGGCHPRTGPVLGQVRAAVIHHTVTANRYSRGEAPAIVLGICRYHRNANGWNDIGYNALVDRFGTIYAGRDGGLARPVVGAHAQGFNAQTAGIAAIGTYTSKALPRRPRRGISTFLAWKLKEAAIPPREVRGHARLISSGGPLSRYPAGARVRVTRILGHRKVGLTECPGRGAQHRLDQITRRTVRKMRR
jgi:hypothetical protein